MTRKITITECLTAGGAQGKEFTFTSLPDAIKCVREVAARCYAAYYLMDGYNSRTYMLGTDALVAQGLPTALVGKVFDAETGEEIRALDNLADELAKQSARGACYNK